MDIGAALTTEFAQFDPSSRVAKLMGAFKERRASAILIVDREDDVVGVVTRKQLVSTRHDPEQKARTLMRTDVPHVDRRDDLREVSRQMVESDLPLVPVYDGEVFEGVVTAKSVARSVESNLDALDVADVYTRDLVAAAPDTTLGEVIHRLRTHGISRVPVIEDGADGHRNALGMVSYHDLLDFVVRTVDQEQGGTVDGFDGHGGEGSRGNYRTHGGFGERAGGEARLLDLPVRDVMNSPVATTAPATSLGRAVGQLLSDDYSSLVVQEGDRDPEGIVTLTDVLRSLTWTPDDETRLQIFGMGLLTDLTRADVAEMIEAVDDKYEEMDVIEAYVILHKHRERLRGTPLIRATIRLFTDRGRFAGTGEEYGAGPAIRAARDRLERTVLDDKSHTMDDRRPDRKSAAVEAQAQQFLEWWEET